jgi:hypothetical protein
VTEETKEHGRGVVQARPRAFPPASGSHARWLLLARVTWIAVAVAALAIVVFSVPSSFEHYRTVCTAALQVCSEREVGQPTPEGVRALRDVGLPVDLSLIGGDEPLTLLVLKTGFALSFLLVPLSIGVAVLRSRLFDVDVLINRTLVYGLLTAFLGLLYFGGVTATQATFQALTGQQQLPLLTIVASTLVIAALFNPLRRRIQSFIDRRFYRSKYDARKTLETFSARLRDETDLEALSEDLVGLVRDTMQPAYVSLWLRSTHYRRTKE